LDGSLFLSQRDDPLIYSVACVVFEPGFSLPRFLILSFSFLLEKANPLSKVQIAHFKEAFDILDKDQDGRLSAEDIQKVFRFFCLSPVPSAVIASVAFSYVLLSRLHSLVLVFELLQLFISMGERPQDYPIPDIQDVIDRADR
jgi:hypothetical protein